MEESGKIIPKEGEKIQIPVIAEVLNIHKGIETVAKVEVKKEINERVIEDTILLEEEDLEVKHVPINKYITEAPAPVRHEDNSTIISVLKEVVVVEKRLMLVEEIHIIRTRKQTNATISETVREENVKVSRS